MKKDTHYFSHDSNAFTDPKIVKLFRKHGFSGYGMRWFVLEALSQQYDYTYKVEDIEDLAFTAHANAGDILEMINWMVDIGLLETDGDVFWSDSLKRRMELKESKRQKRSRAGKKGAAARWNGSDSDDEKPPNGSPKSDGKNGKVDGKKMAKKQSHDGKPENDQGQDEKSDDNPESGSQKEEIENTSETAGTQGSEGSENTGDSKRIANALQPHSEGDANAMQKNGKERKERKERKIISSKDDISPDGDHLPKTEELSEKEKKLLAAKKRSGFQYMFEQELKKNDLVYQGGSQENNRTYNLLSKSKFPAQAREYGYEPDEFAMIMLKLALMKPYWQSKIASVSDFYYQRGKIHNDLKAELAKKEHKQKRSESKVLGFDNIPDE